MGEEAEVLPPKEEGEGDITFQTPPALKVKFSDQQEKSSKDLFLEKFNQVGVSYTYWLVYNSLFR
jgi:hypothetical protein